MKTSYAIRNLENQLIKDSRMLDLCKQLLKNCKRDKNLDKVAKNNIPFYNSMVLECGHKISSLKSAIKKLRS